MQGNTGVHDEQESSYVVRVGQVWVDQAGVWRPAGIQFSPLAEGWQLQRGLAHQAHDVPGESAMPVAHRHPLCFRRVDHRLGRMQVGAEVVLP